MSSSMKAILGLVCAIVLAAGGGVALAQDAGEERSLPDGCAGCHTNLGMAETVAQWEDSQHGASFDWGAGANTYCAQCKAPPVWDPTATSDDNEPVAVEDWPDVNCDGCHPPHNLRVAWGTPIGVLVDPTAADPADAWEPIYDANELCEHCHSGARHARDFQGWGNVMFAKKAVECVDCHMPDVPNSSPDGVGESHTWRVAENLPYSCGIGNAACHANKTEEWALKQIEKEKLHGKN